MTTNETIKQQHTPGPWTLGPIEPAEISRGHWITHGSYKGVIGILGGSPSEANAALIVQAPAMKEALTNLLDWYDMDEGDLRSLMNAARIALAERCS